MTWAQNKEELTKIVQIGDPITMDVGFDQLLGSRVVGRGFDDRVGAFIVAEVLRMVQKEKLQCVYGVSTVQEELGLRGARTSAFRIDPHLGIAIDVTFASDCPDIDKRKVETCLWARARSFHEVRILIPIFSKINRGGNPKTFPTKYKLNHVLQGPTPTAFKSIAKELLPVC